VKKNADRPRFLLLRHRKALLRHPAFAFEALLLTPDKDMSNSSGRNLDARSALPGAAPRRAPLSFPCTTAAFTLSPAHRDGKPSRHPDCAPAVDGCGGGTWRRLERTSAAWFPGTWIRGTPNGKGDENGSVRFTLPLYQLRLFMTRASGIARRPSSVKAAAAAISRPGQGRFGSTALSVITATGARPPNSEIATL